MSETLPFTLDPQALCHMFSDTLKAESAFCSPTSDKYICWAALDVHPVSSTRYYVSQTNFLPASEAVTPSMLSTSPCFFN